METSLVWYHADRVGHKRYFIAATLYDSHDWFGYTEYIFKNPVTGKIDVAQAILISFSLFEFY